MRRLTFIVLVFVCTFATSAYARSMEEERFMCLALNALARTQCKTPLDYSYIGKQRADIYIFNSFYGAKYTDFYCKIGQGEIQIMSKNKLFRRSVPYYIDDKECGVIEYFPASCTNKHVIRCCFPKSEKELKADKEAEFWERPIPDLLKEDQKEALEKLHESQNKTVKSSETMQE